VTIPFPVNDQSRTDLPPKFTAMWNKYLVRDQLRDTHMSIYDRLKRIEDAVFSQRRPHHYREGSNHQGHHGGGPGGRGPGGYNHHCNEKKDKDNRHDGQPSDKASGGRSLAF
jgi:hypothetical protein